MFRRSCLSRGLIELHSHQPEQHPPSPMRTTNSYSYESSFSVINKRETLQALEQTTSKKQRFSAEASASEIHHLSPRKKNKGSWRKYGGHARTNQRRKRRKTGDFYRRDWVFSSWDCSAFKDRFVVVSYNILGVENVSKHLDLYRQVPPNILDWERRKKLIHEELNLYMPSILCFQEVDRFCDLADLLEKDGYKGVYKARTGEACDGCAIFWREELFSLLHEETIEFLKFGLRDNVAQLCIFKMNADGSNSSRSTSRDPQMATTTPNRILLVGNIHVLFNPNRGEMKLGQVRLLLEKAQTLSQEWGNIPVVIAGDLNSVPQSALYQFLASSELDILLHDRRKISGQIKFPSRQRGFGSRIKFTERPLLSECQPSSYKWSEEEIKLATGSNRCTYLQHRLKLRSAYSGVPQGSDSTRDYSGEPLATTYHSKFMGTVDYIWHSEELIPIGVVETLPINILRKAGGLPSENWGSDHLALVCELAFCK